MGYSPPKCSCNDNLTNIQVNRAYPYLNVYMPRPMPRVLTYSLTHTNCHYEILFSRQRYLFVCRQPSDRCICGHTPINDCVDNPSIIISGHTSINNYMDNPPIYYSGHTPINNCWSTLRNHVMHSHLLFYGVPMHMKCNVPFPLTHVNISCMHILIRFTCNQHIIHS